MSDRVDDARRTALRLTALAAAGAAGAAGCLDDSGDSGSADTAGRSDGSTDESDRGGSGGDDPEGDHSRGDAAGGTDAVDEPEPTGGETADRDGGDTVVRDGDTETPAGTSEGDLDLREANVTAVEFEESGGAARFSVTLYHDDDGEDGYANWWQVENLDGERLGRRELMHAHSTDPFTRSETVEVPGGVTCVVVRGHDQTHEFGGRAMLVNLDSGERRAVDQGAEKESFDEADCP